MTILKLPVTHTMDWLNRLAWTEDGVTFLSGDDGVHWATVVKTQANSTVVINLTQEGLGDLINDALFYAECMGPADTGDFDYRPAARRVIAALERQGVTWTRMSELTGFISVKDITVGVSLWQSPSGRLHARQRCSGNGQSRKTKPVTITDYELQQAIADGKVCRCYTWTVAA